MSAEVIFRDFERSKATESYVIHQIEGFIGKFIPNETPYDLKIRVGEVRHRNALRRKPKFQCSVALKLPNLKRVLNVTRDGFNFHESVNEAAMALRKMLRTQHDKKIDRKKRVSPRGQRHEALQEAVELGPDLAAS
jgi:ribosome-associated translation inhibitor RaiA